jgi:predicted RNA binding protein YcfA (HicA-like mRNA interferase family)
MKIPRDLTGRELIKKLRILGYDQTRQVGSHIRLTTLQNGTHHITIPNHDPLKLGTLSSILSEVAAHFNLSKDELIDKLF